MHVSTVQIAGLHDLKGINNLISVINSKNESYYKPTDFNENDLVESENNIIFVTKKVDVITGYLWLKSNQSFNSENCDAEIIIVVSPTLQRQGIGKKLLESAITYAKNKTSINKLISTVKYDNFQSKCFFKNRNFTLKHEDGFGCYMVFPISR